MTNSGHDKVKSGLNYKQIGEKVKAAWKLGSATQQIDREALVTALNLDASVKHGIQKNLVFDIISDQIIDDNTRMVWLYIPTPDIRNSGQTWNDYADQFDTDDLLEDLGKAVIFGCGR